jgi:hypothetical protein
MVRFVNPDAEVRLAGGREIHLRTLQPLALHIVNSIFLGDYLTSEGQPGAADLAMIADAGFTVEGAEDAPGELAAALARPDLVLVRRRGAGTALPANTVLPAHSIARTRRRRAVSASFIARTRRRRAVSASFPRRCEARSSLHLSSVQSAARAFGARSGEVTGVSAGWLG